MIIQCILGRVGRSYHLTDLNNCRAIALSSSLSKVLETLLLCKVSTVDVDSDRFQFGFKAGNSTDLCTSVMKNVVDYYTNQGSYVFLCFVDFSKAFDKVNYWKLFHKLLDDNVSSDVTGLLAFWYSNQSSRIRWKSALSVSFSIGNGTRQGGILSPHLFTRYIRELIYEVSYCGVGCNVGGTYCNLLAYVKWLYCSNRYVMQCF